MVWLTIISTRSKASGNLGNCLTFHFI